MDPVKMGRLIALLRKERHLTQEALGEKLGVTGKTVSRWETGSYMPDIGKLLDLAEVLGISVSELLSGERTGVSREPPEKAGSGLAQALSRDSSFSCQERLAYFKRKWLLDHRGAIVFLCLGFAAALTGAVISGRAVPSLLCPLLGLGLYLLVYNKMMVYAERNTFR